MSQSMLNEAKFGQFNFKSTLSVIGLCNNCINYDAAAAAHFLKIILLLLFPPSKWSVAETAEYSPIRIIQYFGQECSGERLAD